MAAWLEAPGVTAVRPLSTAACSVASRVPGTCAVSWTRSVIPRAVRTSRPCCCSPGDSGQGQSGPHSHTARREGKRVSSSGLRGSEPTPFTVTLPLGFGEQRCSRVGHRQKENQAFLSFSNAPKGAPVRDTVQVQRARPASPRLQPERPASRDVIVTDA